MSMFSFQAIHNPYPCYSSRNSVVYRLCQCSLFKQFTTSRTTTKLSTRCLSIMSMFSFQAIHNIANKRIVDHKLFIDYVNVLFSSNSQLVNGYVRMLISCLSIMSMFSFQAIHNCRTRTEWGLWVVYRLCQCSLFKQFTTVG